MLTVATLSADVNLPGQGGHAVARDDQLPWSPCPACDGSITCIVCKELVRMSLARLDATAQSHPLVPRNLLQAHVILEPTTL